MPMVVMARLENVATPATAATVVVPVSVPPPGFVPIAIVTLPVNDVAGLPTESCAATWIAGAMIAPAADDVGCTVNASRDAAPAVTLNAALVTGEPATPAALATSV